MSNKPTQISKDDLKVYASERLTDHDDAGGMPTSQVLTGAKNELFNPISNIARVNGACNLRLVYFGVQRADDAPLLGSFVAITKPALDPSVSYMLFKANKFGELRTDGIKRMESYFTATIESRMTLLSTQAKHSKIIQAYQRVGEPLPMAGDVYCLRQDQKGYPQAEQYVQVVAVKAENRLFNLSGTKDDTFERTVLKIEINQKLNHDFVGVDYPRLGYADNPCKIRETHVADAAQYYGVKPLSQAIGRGQMQIHVPSLMEKLVPTNQMETSLVDVRLGDSLGFFDATQGNELDLVTVSVNRVINAEFNKIELGQAILPHSIASSFGTGWRDQNGILYSHQTEIGTVDYANGSLQIDHQRYSTTLRSLYYRPATVLNSSTQTAKIDIEANNRSVNYVFTLPSLPLNGSVQVSYRSQGTWYSLKDNGNGALRANNSAQGSGSINPVTGTVSLTCGELPDIGSAILFTWTLKNQLFNRSNSHPTAKMVLQLAHDADPASIQLVGDGYRSQGQADGTITGSWTGKYDSQSRKIYLETSNDLNKTRLRNIQVSYSGGEKNYQKHTAPLRNREGQITLDLGDVPIQPNSVRLRWNLLIEDYDSPIIETLTRLPASSPLNRRWIDPYKTVRDDGNGKLIDDENQQVGMIDYAQRRLTFKPDTTVNIPKPAYKMLKISEQRVVEGGKAYLKTQSRQVFSHFDYVPAAATMPIDESAFAEVWFYDTSEKHRHQEQLKAGQFEIDLLPHYAEQVVAGSVALQIAIDDFFDKNGKIYRYLSNYQRAEVGKIDYLTGKINLQLDNGMHLVNRVKSLATTIELNSCDAVSFRVPSSPVRPNSLQVRASTASGETLTATADLHGKVRGNGIEGSVNVAMGVVDLRFGQWLDVSGNESQAWFDRDNVQGDQVWKPLQVLADSILYNVVAYSYLPVDSSIIKIDTVRLPQDGRVPIFRRGDTILIRNQQQENIGSAHRAGETVQLNRQNLDRICVKDANGKSVLANLWQYDLDAGTITWATPLDLSPYQMPLTVSHSIEERNRIVHADIDGTLQLIFPTKRSYPIENTYVSSVLIGGDLQVRASVPFTQRNWNQQWLDEPVGEQLLNKLNVQNYPIVLTDDGAITERWLIKWLSSNNFELYGETLGFVLRSDSLQDLAPINPATNKPYFRIPRQAFGNAATWAAQDVIRFNTWGTLLPVWVICAVQPSSAQAVDDDGFSHCLYGDTTEI